LNSFFLVSSRFCNRVSIPLLRLRALSVIASLSSLFRPCDFIVARLELLVGDGIANEIGDVVQWLLDAGIP
jgi:hypothetical protein